MTKQPEAVPNAMRDSTVYPHLIGLHFAMQELNSELTVDTIQESPRMVLMALEGLERRMKSLVDLATLELTRTDDDSKE